MSTGSMIYWTGCWVITLVQSQSHVYPMKCFLFKRVSPSANYYPHHHFTSCAAVYLEHYSTCLCERVFHHCGNMPTCHECFPLSCGFIHFGEHWHHCNKNMQTDPPTSVPSVNLRASIHVSSCQLHSTTSASFLFSLTLHGNRPSLFLMIYPCHVLDEPPGMPLLRFARYDGLAGWKRQARFGKARYRPERDDGKGLE